MAWTDGACVVDTRTGRVGRITAQTEERLRLAPLSSGRVWDCPVDAVREATEWEQRNADVLDATWRFWRPRRRGGLPPYGNVG
ncbi:hypothetical protein [Streptomyces sp. NPDC049881]|uniref:hypothetical protein n=1 Tax=unclassified Streptomyces TaxID=2593676 RepID=UPI00341817E4